LTSQNNVIYKWTSLDKNNDNKTIEYSIEKYGEAFNPFKKFETIDNDGSKSCYVLVSKDFNNKILFLRLKLNSQIVPPLEILNGKENINQIFQNEKSDFKTELTLKDKNNQLIEAFTLKDKAEKENILIGYLIRKNLPLSLAGLRIGSDEVSKMMMEYVNLSKERFGLSLSEKNKHTLMDEAQKIRDNGSNILIVKTPNKTNNQVLTLTPIYKELPSKVYIFDLNGKVVWDGDINNITDIPMKNLKSGVYLIQGRGKTLKIQFRN
jgi:hypothetical protein